MKSSIAFFIVVFSFSTGAFTDDAPQAGDIIYRKQIDADREIVVSRTAPVDIKMLGGLLSPHLLNDTRQDYHSAFVSAYNIRFELYSKGKPALVLWTRLVEDGWYPYQKGYDILDMVTEANLIDIAETQYGEVSLTRLNLISGAVSAWEIDGAQWTTGAGLVHRDRKNAEAKWGRSSDGSKLTVEIGELGGGGVAGDSRALYEQIGNEWKFRVVKLWDAPRVPATRPAE